MSSSNRYSPYYYLNSQQRAAQQYRGYQTAQASSSVPQQPRQYPQSTPTPTAQSQDYMSYNSYGGQASFGGGGQVNSWGSGNYSGSHDISNRAAEVLCNLSNTAYSSTSLTAVSSSGLTPANAPTPAARYSTTTPQPAQQQSHTAHSAYGQSQPRPRSVNASHALASTSRGLSSLATAADYRSQRMQAIYNQQRRSAGPAHNQYSRNTATPVSAARTSAMTSTTQYQDYRSRQWPHVETARSVQAVPNTAVSSSSSYADTQAAAPIEPTPSAMSVTEQYDNASTITVNPMAVYDPWPEYQRKQEVLQAKKAAEDAVRTEQERKAEEARLVEEERKKAEEEKRAEEERQIGDAQVPVHLPPGQPKSRKGHGKKTQQQAASSDGEPSADEAAAVLEAEVRAMMSKLRELNGKDPALLARIWKEERSVKAPRSPTVQNKATPQPLVAQPAQAKAPQTANQRKKAVAKQASSSSNTAPSAPMSTPSASTSATHGGTAAVPAATRPAGNTIWPPEKKAQLATAAATYLNAQNKDKPLTSETILHMLDSNPSYIELCEQLESMQLKLDRAAFAKNLLTAVPDVNSASRQSQATQTPKPQAGRPPLVGTLQQNSSAHQMQAPSPTVVTNSHLKHQSTLPNRSSATPAAASPGYPAPAHSPDLRPYPPFLDDEDSHTPAPVAEMIPNKPELNQPVNKEEAARKRTFNDLIDLTTLDEEDDEPPMKKSNNGSTFGFAPTSTTLTEHVDTKEGMTRRNFPNPAIPFPTTVSYTAPPPLPPSELRMRNIVQTIDKKMALRRNSYNIKTIARDVLLACGRHPEERQLNVHLEILKASLAPLVDNNSDLSTLRWDIIDPGNPPRGYYKDRSQVQEAEDADDEDDRDDEGSRPDIRAKRPELGADGNDTVRALPSATNPFKAKRRGRPPHNSFPQDSSREGSQLFMTPSRPSGTAKMSASAPRPNAGSVDYSAFRSATEIGPDGKPLLTKEGRPVRWRNQIHGPAAALARLNSNGHAGPLQNPSFTPSQPSSLRNVRTSDAEPIIIQSRSPSVAHPSETTRYQSFKCEWQKCKADLHNLETLKKHVQKVHRKETPRGTLECLWDRCGREVANVDAVTGFSIEKHTPFGFTNEAEWREHLELRHFGPLSWDRGDGPASGLSDANESASEVYLNDAQGRWVTPRITADPSRVDKVKATPRPRGRLPKVTQEQETQFKLEQAFARKKRLGAPGMEKSGSTLANEKRRRGFIDQDDLEGGHKVVDLSD
ncbi:hypothetical protein BCR34DRAFT_616880 [Clohesyomyces aquaticus]|uniref:C2H2-type domain-containing protein n=1 Tax=Clohesyomyces aquaticus TaxID=1231657 RepID=A0A1Y1Z943_9PLEO|nr:hypothetical protein BCR34DRAFT_616880 [Clohesyomyces aquaticus]